RIKNASTSPEWCGSNLICTLSFPQFVDSACITTNASAYPVFIIGVAFNAQSGVNLMSFLNPG
ncbi:hypothetical protein ONR07_24010, partial [Salmonella enterica subsp. enterica serovar Anatum]|nr:hypothetical protein [Salmonella enterica subsp. enterica serovar Anatum]